MSGPLRGPSRRLPATRERVVIRISPEARRALCSLLYEADMTGVGYSEFIMRAVEAARAERGDVDMTPEDFYTPVAEDRRP